MVSNLAIFSLATYLATFKKIVQFFPNHLVTLMPGCVVWFKTSLLTSRIPIKYTCKIFCANDPWLRISVLLRSQVGLYGERES